MKHSFIRSSATVVAVALTLCGCAQRSAMSLRKALFFAGDNKPELEEVLSHYKGKDELKYEAAKFLICNMPFHTSMTGDYEGYFDAADSLLSSAGENGPESLRDLSKAYGDKLKYKADIKYISADYLMDNIDRAFEDWRNCAWAQHLSFDDFCEYLLPYTCSSTQPLLAWREGYVDFARSYIDHLGEFYDCYDDPAEASKLVNKELIRSISHWAWSDESLAFPIYRPETFVKLYSAKCNEYAHIAVMSMRSKGIPVVMDYVPQWPDRENGHAWCSILNRNGRGSVFAPFLSDPGKPHYAFCRYPKVYRETYAINREYLRLLHRERGRVPSELDSPFYKDVTSEYVAVSDLSVPVFRSALLKRTVYVAVFDNKRWKVVSWGKVRGGKARFERMGRNITYMAMMRKGDEIVPASYPFRVDGRGEITLINPDFEITETITIDGKAPAYHNVFSVVDTLHSGRIDASQRADFSSVEKVAPLPEWETISGRVKVSQSRPYRYWRFCVEAGERSDMSEIYFFDSEGLRIVPRVISIDEDYGKLADYDPLTWCSAEGELLKGYFDFGRDVTLSRIEYIRRGDGNSIVPGDEYLVYYWDNSEWILLSSQTATGTVLTVSGVPSGALLYIRGISRGRHNRIFRWNSDKQKVEWT